MSRTCIDKCSVWTEPQVSCQAETRPVAATVDERHGGGEAQDPRGEGVVNARQGEEVENGTVE